jgi:protein TonB
MNATRSLAVDAAVPSPRAFPAAEGPWPEGGDWFARLIGLQLLLVAFAAAGSWSRAWQSPVAPASLAADEVPVIDFPVEQAGDAPASRDTLAEVADPLAAPEEAALPELVEATPVESQAEESPMPELVEALPAPAERPAFTDGPAERPRPVPAAISTSSPQAAARPAVQAPRPGAVGGTGTASAPVLFGAAGSGRFPLPPYPSEARRRGVEGNVMLQVEVSEQGRPGVPRIESSSGSSSLDRAAVDWIRARWRWEPGPVRHYRIPISYQIR